MACLKVVQGIQANEDYFKYMWAIKIFGSGTGSVDGRCTGVGQAVEPAHLQVQVHRQATDRQVSEAALVAATHRRGRRSAGRTRGVGRAGAAHDEDLTRRRFDVQHLNGGQVRKGESADGVIMHRDMIT